MFVGDEFAEEYAPIFCSTCAGFAVSEDEAAALALAAAARACGGASRGAHNLLFSH